MKRLLAGVLPLCLLLAGCDVLPYPRELEDTMLVRVLGVDWSEEEVALLAAAQPEGGEQAEVLTVFGTSWTESREKLKQAGEEYVALTHVTQLVAGRESDMRAVLEAALAEREVGQTATVWMAREGTAQSLLEQVKGGAKRLTSIELNGGWKAPTVLEALAQLEEEGQVNLPMLAVEHGILEAVGTVIWREGKD